jgi:hypothetical protein
LTIASNAERSRDVCSPMTLWILGGLAAWCAAAGPTALVIGAVITSRDGTQRPSSSRHHGALRRIV